MMRYFARIAVSFAVAGFVLGSLGCRTAAVYDVARTPLPANTLHSHEDSIARSAWNLGWSVERVSLGMLVVSRRIHIHLASATVEFGSDFFSIELRNSMNLKQSDGRIHKTYNAWVEELERAIISGATSNPVDPPDRDLSAAINSVRIVYSDLEDKRAARFEEFHGSAIFREEIERYLGIEGALDFDGELEAEIRLSKFALNKMIGLASAMAEVRILRGREEVRRFSVEQGVFSSRNGPTHNMQSLAELIAADIAVALADQKAS